MIGASPPSPFMCGSTTCSTRPAATAASNAVPPASSTAIPDAVASQWVEATIPKVPASCGRVVNEEPCGSIVLLTAWPAWAGDDGFSCHNRLAPWPGQPAAAPIGRNRRAA